MTPKKAEKVTGCTIVETAPGVWCAMDGEAVRAVVKTRRPQVAAFLLAEEVLRQNRMLALARDGFRCVRCGSMGNLHAHHKTHRGLAGSNRDDRVENLETLCHECHERAHSS